MVHQSTTCPNDHLAHFREISANTEEKKQLCNKTAARYSTSWRNHQQLSNAESLTALKYTVKACTYSKFYWNHERKQWSKNHENWKQSNSWFESRTTLLALLHQVYILQYLLQEPDPSAPAPSMAIHPTSMC